jgi:hypothetical protein
MNQTKTKPATKKTNWQKQRVLDNEQYDPTTIPFRKALMDHYRRKYIDKVEQ